MGKSGVLIPIPFAAIVLAAVADCVCPLYTGWLPPGSVWGPGSVSQSMRTAKSRYLAAKDSARRQAGVNLASVLGIDFYVGGWSRRVDEALALQWPVVQRQRSDAGG